MERLDRLKEAQKRIHQLRASGADMTSREARRAANHLMTLLRGATPEELQAFDQWKQEEEKTGGPR